MLNADSNANANANADEKFSPNWSLFVAIKVRRLRFVAFDLCTHFFLNVTCRKLNQIKTNGSLSNGSLSYLVTTRRNTHGHVLHIVSVAITI